MILALPTKAETVWLAGYPRSGAALVRTILAHCFGHHTSSYYEETGLGEAYCAALKHVKLQGRDPADVDAEIGGQSVLTVKTHSALGLPIARRSIVIVRDARRTLESLLAFYADNNKVEYTWGQMVRGEHYWGEWGAWVRGWAVHARPGTLWLRYEDAMADLRGTVDRMAAWLPAEPIGYEIPPFEQLHGGTPNIFRKAEVSGNGGMPEDVEEGFWRLHGATMAMLHYQREGEE